MTSSVRLATLPCRGPLRHFGQDFFTFTVPTGHTFRSLTAVSVDLFTSGDLFAFIAIRAVRRSRTMRHPTFGGDASGLLGWLHVAASDQGTDILPAMGVAGDGATGFTGALGVGQYRSGWRTRNPSITISASKSVPPEPSTWVMMLVGLAGVGFVGHRTRAVFGVQRSALSSLTGLRRHVREERRKDRKPSLVDHFLAMHVKKLEDVMPIRFSGRLADGGSMFGWRGLSPAPHR